MRLPDSRTAREPTTFPSRHRSERSARSRSESRTAVPAAAAAASPIDRERAQSDRRNMAPGIIVRAPSALEIAPRCRLYDPAIRAGVGFGWPPPARDDGPQADPRGAPAQDVPEARPAARLRDPTDPRRAARDGLPRGGARSDPD